MELTIREAAALIGRSPRTLRGQIARGEITGRKHGGQWRIARTELPLTDRQRRALETRADDLRQVVESALPEQVRKTRPDHGVLSLDTFRLGIELWGVFRGLETQDAAPREDFHAGMCALSRAKHAFDASRKIACLREARDAFATSVAGMLLDAGDHGDEHTRFIERVEGELLRSLSGLLRWAERLPERRR